MPKIPDAVIAGMSCLEAPVPVPSYVCTEMRPVTEAVCALLNYTNKVAFERLGKNNSKRWREADDRTNGVFRCFIDLMCMSSDSRMQHRFFAQNAKRLENACDLKLWKTFCGRSHSVPQELIKTLKTEISNIRKDAL